MTHMLRVRRVRVASHTWTPEGKIGRKKRAVVFSPSCETRDLQEKSACNEKQPLEFLLVKIPILLFFFLPLSSLFLGLKTWSLAPVFMVRPFWSFIITMTASCHVWKKLCIIAVMHYLLCMSGSSSEKFAQFKLMIMMMMIIIINNHSDALIGARGVINL